MIALFAFLFIFYTFIDNSFSIYREVKTDTISLSILAPNSVLVTFNPNGGTLATEESTRELNEGDAIGTLPVPTYQAHQFLGWYTEQTGGTKIKETTIVNSSTTYYARWIENDSPLNYVFYIPGECSFTSTGLQNGSNGDCISTINPTEEDIDYTESTLSAKRYIDTGVAVYNAINHENDVEIGFTIVRYNSNENEYRATLVNTKAEIDNSQLKYPGFTFRKKDNSGSYVLQSRKNYSSNAEVTLSPADVQSVIIYRTAGAIYYSINGGTKIKVNDAYNPIFDLNAWFGAAPQNEDASVAQRFFIGTLSKMYIKLEPPEMMTVTFNLNYEGATTTTTKEVAKSGPIGDLPTPTREGFAFLGWFTEATNGTQIDSNTIITTNITYYAHWIESVTVTLHPNEGQVTPTTITVPINTAVGTLPTPTKTNYTFAGWYQDTNLTIPANSETIITEDTDFYAKWLQSVTVTLNANNGTVSPSTITVGQGTAVGTLPTPEREGYTFDGWYQEPELTNLATAETIVTENTTYYAKWIENITITLNADGGTVTPTTIVIPKGTAIGELPVPELTDYDFVGWYTDNTYATQVTEQTVFNASTTIIAKWEETVYVACIGNTCYNSIQKAVNAVTANNTKTTITIISDVEPTDVTTIPRNKWVELDIGSYTISTPLNSSYSIFKNQGTLDVINGTITSRGGYIFENLSGSTLNIKGGTFTYNNTNHTESKVIEIKGGTVYITGGTLTCNSKAAVINVNTGGTLNVSGGTIKGLNTFKGQAIYNNGGTTTVSGTAYLENNSRAAVDNGRAALHNNAGTMTILGGTIISKNNAAVKNNDIMTIGDNTNPIDTTTPVMQGSTYGLEIADGKTVTIYDGIFKGKGYTADKAINDESLVTLDNAEIDHTTETIDNEQYDVAYLVETLNNNGTNSNKGKDESETNDTQTFKEMNSFGELPITKKENPEFLDDLKKLMVGK